MQVLSSTSFEAVTGHKLSSVSPTSEPHEEHRRPSPHTASATLALHALDITSFGPPFPAAIRLRPRSFEQHLEGFVPVMKLVIDDGAEMSPALSRARREVPKAELRTSNRRVRTYMNRHDAELARRREGITLRAVFGNNQDLEEFCGDLRNSARGIRQARRFGPPAEDPNVHTHLGEPFRTA